MQDFKEAINDANLYTKDKEELFTLLRQLDDQKKTPIAG